MTAIECRNLSRNFGSLKAVDGLNLSINKGELLCLLGLNSAGKTSTIKMLTCTLLPSGGEAFIMGHPLSSHRQEIKSLINLAPQESALSPLLNVEENLELMAGIYGFRGTERQEKIENMIARFQMEEHRKKRVRNLSGGIQRRLSLAMALISDPQVLFLDEPTLGLDILARRKLWEILKELKGLITIVLTTHYLEEAEALSDRIGILHRGKLLALGTAAEIKELAGETKLDEAFLALTGKESEV